MQIIFQATHTDFKEKTVNNKNSDLQLQVIKVQLLAWQWIG